MAKSADLLAEWAVEHAVRIAWPPTGEPEDLAPLSILDCDLAGADLVFLGEMNHFVHEKSDFRLLLARYLMSRGVSRFAEELGWSDGQRLQRWFQTGDPSVFDTLSLFGATSDLRGDRDDRPTGVLAASFDAYPIDLMRAEQERFYRGLREAASGRPLGYFGFDIDALPGGDYADISALLQPFQGRPRVGACLAGLARVGGETAGQEARRLDGVRPLLAAIGELPSEVTAQATAALGALVDSLAYVDATYGAPNYEALRPGMAWREDAMKRRFAEIASLGGGAPTAVMSHAFHLAKDDQLLAPVGGVGPGSGQTSSIGHHLVQELGRKAFSIWMLYGSGEDSQPFPDLPHKASYPPETLNAQLARVGSPLLLRIADAPGRFSDRPIGVGHMYNTVVPTVLQGQVDAIVILPTVSPMRSPAPPRAAGAG